MYETEKEVLMVKEASSIYNSSSAEVIRPLTIDDFDDMPMEPRVELYYGEKIVMEVPKISHQDAVAEILYQTMDFIKKNKGKCKPIVSPAAAQPDVNDDSTVFQPDFMVVCDQDKLKDGRHVIGAPDWVVEVLSPSTRKQDMQVKKEKYLSSGVREYWMVDTEGEVVIIYKGDNPDVSVIRKMSEPIPVGIYDGDLVIDLSSLTTDDEDLSVVSAAY